MRARHCRMGERARCLARPHRRVDPASGEEAAADRRQLVGEGAVGFEHGALRLLPGDQPVVLVGQRGIAVPGFQLRDAEPFRLQPVVAVRETGIGTAHRGDESIDDLVLDEVPEVTRRDRPLEAAPAILDLLVLGKRVGDEGEDAGILPKHLAKDHGRLLARGAVMIGEEMQHLGAGQLLGVAVAALPWEAQTRHRLVEQPDPGGAAGDRLLVQQLLDVVGELKWSEGAGIAQPRRVAGKSRILELLLQDRVVDPVELEGEEEDGAGDRVDPLLHGLEEAADLRIAHIPGIDEIGVAHDPAERLLEQLVACHCAAERRPGKRRQLAFVTRAQGGGSGFARRQIPLQLAAIASGIEIGEIPFRERTEIAGSAAAVRRCRQSLACTRRDHS